MAVMASPMLDKPSFEPKALAPSSDVMALDSDINGIAPANHEAEVNPPDQDHLELSSQTPAVNGNSLSHTLNGEITLPAANIKELSPSLLSDTLADPIVSLTSATEAPTSDVRDEPVPTQLTSDTEPPSQPTESMDITVDVETAPPVVEPTVAADSALAEVVDTPVDAPQIETTAVAVDAVAPADQAMEDAPSQSKVRAREEDDAEEQPVNKRARTSEDPTSAPVAEDVDMMDEEPAQPASEPAGPTSEPAAATPISLAQAAAPPAAPEPVVATVYKPELEHFDAEPMEDKQKQGLLRVLQNAKKSKFSLAFREPVDPIALNIPTYPEIVKEPMDLKSMENKLKGNQYGSVDDFLADLQRIVRNTFMFNGANHAVTHQARDLERYVNKAVMNHAYRHASQPAATEKSAAPVPVEKKEVRRRSAVKVEKPAAIQPPPPPPPRAASPKTFATLDGVPTIRRGSSHQDGRPKREIQRPKPRDLPYSVKPRKKKFEMDLRFCEHVLTEIKKKKSETFAWPFLKPVDPVALNIPDYHKVIKKPMDVSKVEENLTGGEYQTAKEFKADMDLIFANCFKFNPPNDSVHMLGKECEQWLNELWAQKSAWINKNQPQSDAASDYDSEEEYASAPEEDSVESIQARLSVIMQEIRTLSTEQLMLHNKLEALVNKKTSKKTEKATKAVKSRKSGGSKDKKKPKKAAAPLTFNQKQEISESIGQLDENNMAKAMNIIRNGVPSLSDTNEEELEIDMESIPEDVLRQLYKFVRSVRPPTTQPDVSDDDFEPPRSAHAKTSGKPKKNKPMGKKEQEEKIDAIRRQLSNFQKASSGSEEPASAANDSSSDEDADSESEEE